MRLYEVPKKPLLFTTLIMTETRDCIKCGKPLTDPESVRLGYGPECRRGIKFLPPGKATIGQKIMRTIFPGAHRD